MFQVPTVVGFPSSIDSSSRLYHKYDKAVNAPCVDPSALRQGIVDNSTPGSPSPASPGGTYNNATPGAPWVPVPSPVVSFLTYDMITGNPIVVNVTLPGHPLGSGYVAREVYQTPQGAVVHNHGEGVGLAQSKYNPKPDWINDVWIGQTQRIISGLPSSCSCSVK